MKLAPELLSPTAHYNSIGKVVLVHYGCGVQMRCDVKVVINCTTSPMFPSLIPSKKHYGYNQMKPDERTKFLNWYEECVSENCVFDFKKEILEHCRSDVDILRRGIIKLREDFIQLENIDPLCYSTITLVCMTIY